MHDINEKNDTNVNTSTVCCRVNKGIKDLDPRRERKGVLNKESSNGILSGLRYDHIAPENSNCSATPNTQKLAKILEK